MRYFLMMVLATVLVCTGCDDDDREGGFTSTGEILSIHHNDSLLNLDGLSIVASVGEYLAINGNIALTNLNGLGALTSVGISAYNDFTVSGNTLLPDCEVCVLLGQLSTAPGEIVVDNNLDDACTPVPANCP